MFATVLFASFGKFFPKPTPAMKFVAESAFTVYLFHYLAIYLCAFAIRPYVGDQFTLGLMVTLATTVVTMLGYEFFICRSPLFRALFLGRFSKKSEAAKDDGSAGPVAVAQSGS
jgi:glucans biosynthesis protein C